MNASMNVTILLVVGIALALSCGYAQPSDQSKVEKLRGVDLKFKRSGRLSTEDANNVAMMRMSGLRRDRSQIPAMIALLKNPPHQAYAYSCIHALAQMGASEALPALEPYLPRTVMVPSSDLNNFAVVAKARLLAEGEAANIADDKTRAVTKVRRFYHEIGLSSNSLNAGMVAYHTPPTDENGRTWMSAGGERDHPLEFYAIRELADMVYAGPYHDFASLPEISHVDFSLDYSSALKMRLAPYSREQRISIIISDLSRKTALRGDDSYEIQLAINEGTLASQAVADELQKMDKHRAQYDQGSHHGGFVAMFHIISGVGDQTQMPLLRHFMDDSDAWIRHYAETAYRNLSRGDKYDRILGY